MANEQSLRAQLVTAQNDAAAWKAEAERLQIAVEMERRQGMAETEKVSKRLDALLPTAREIMTTDGVAYWREKAAELERGHDVYRRMVAHLRERLARTQEANRQLATAIRRHSQACQGAAAIRRYLIDRANARASRAETERDDYARRLAATAASWAVVANERDRARETAARLEQERDAHAALKAAVALLREHGMMEPCRCDPPGSGEEWCNGGCHLRQELAESKKREG